MTDKPDAITLAQLEAIAAEIDPREEKGGDAFRAFVVVLACLFTGVDVGSVSELTGYDRSFVEFLLGNLGSNGMAIDGRLRVDWVEDDGIDETGFMATALCAMGLIEVQWISEVQDKPDDRVAYRHPDNPKLTWGGRGRRPAWLRVALKGGASLEDLAEV